MDIGETLELSWSNGGGTTIKRTKEGYELYETAEMNGSTQLIGTYKTFEYAVAKAKTLT